MQKPLRNSLLPPQDDPLGGQDQLPTEDKPLDFDDDFWDAFLPDDEPEPLPEKDDIWIEQDFLPTAHLHA